MFLRRLRRLWPLLQRRRLRLSPSLLRLSRLPLL
jgi:hypothetical protein